VGLTNASIDSDLGVPAGGMVTVFNSARVSARITAVSAMPVPGVLTPRLADVGVGATGRGLAADYRWPPPGIPVVPAVGAELRPGNDNIIFGSLGSKLRHYYAIAGLTITYTYQGQSYSLAVWSGFTTCFTAGLVKPGKPDSPGLAAQCGKKTQVSGQVNLYVEKMGGAQQP
jgi:hypothetical protein